MERGQRAAKRARRSLSTHLPSETPSSSRASSVTAPTPGSTTDEDPMLAEPSLSNYNVHELPSQDDGKRPRALAARVEYLEAETKQLRSHMTVDGETVPLLLRIEQIADNDTLVRFYTGFASYALFLSFFKFLGLSVYRLSYWGDSERKTSLRRKNTALTPINQYFLTFRLNLQVKDLAHRFNISHSKNW